MTENNTIVVVIVKLVPTAVGVYIKHASAHIGT